MLEINKPALLAKNYQWTSTLHQRKSCSECSSVSVWTFNPQFSCGLHGKPADNLFNVLFDKVGNRGRLAARQGLQLALHALAQACSANTSERTVGILHSRSTAATAILPQYKESEVTDRVFTKVLDVLVKNGFVTMEKGFRGKGQMQGLSTLWIPTQFFVDWLNVNSSTLTILGFKSENETEVIRLKNFDKKLIAYVDDEVTISYRRSVEASNRMRTSSVWKKLPISQGQQFVEGNERVVIPSDDLMCHRIFNEDLESGGRFYCRAQQLSKEERGTITINDKPTVELDYKSLHPRLLYNLRGLEAPYYCYGTNAQTREDTKLISLLAINCSSYEQATRTLADKRKITNQTAAKLIDEYILENSPIKDDLFRSSWKRLQFVDSQIVDQVLAKATVKGIGVLPIHDSFIVSTDDAFWARDCLAASYKSIVGFEPVVHWEVA